MSSLFGFKENSKLHWNSFINTQEYFAENVMAHIFSFLGVGQVTACQFDCLRDVIDCKTDKKLITNEKRKNKWFHYFNKYDF